MRLHAVCPLPPLISKRLHMRRVAQVLQFDTIEYGRTLTAQGFGFMFGTPLARKLLPLLGNEAFVLLCNGAAATMMGLRALVRDSSPTSRALYVASLVPMVAGNLKSVVVDAATMDAGVRSGMGRGECSAACENVTLMVYIAAPHFWAALYNLSPTLPFWAAASITMASQIPYRLGLSALAAEAAEDERSGSGAAAQPSAVSEA